MPEVPEPPGEGDRPAPTENDTGAEGESLDVTEWVSELRRLYVEPKTRAEIRQEGTFAPLKRKLHLPGSRRPALPADIEAGPPDPPATDPGPATPPGSPDPPAPEPTAAPPTAEPPPASAPAPAAVAPEVVPAPTPVAATPEVKSVATPDYDQPAAAWLFSYLQATGHGAELGDHRVVSPTAADDADVDGSPPSDQMVSPTNTDAPQDHPDSVGDEVDEGQPDPGQPEAPSQPRSLAELASMPVAASVPLAASTEETLRTAPAPEGLMTPEAAAEDAKVEASSTAADARRPCRRARAGAADEVSPSRRWPSRSRSRRWTWPSRAGAGGGSGRAGARAGAGSRAGAGAGGGPGRAGAGAGAGGGRAGAGAGG